jgi:hypothetical protein
MILVTIFSKSIKIKSVIILGKFFMVTEAFLKFASNFTSFTSRKSVWFKELVGDAG